MEFQIKIDELFSSNYEIPAYKIIISINTKLNFCKVMEPIAAHITTNIKPETNKQKKIVKKLLTENSSEENFWREKQEDNNRQNQRSYQRWFDKRIYKTEMKFWTVLGSQGCRGKIVPTCKGMRFFVDKKKI